MTVERLRPIAEGILDPLVSVCRRLGLGPNLISVLGFVVALGAGGAFAMAASTSRWYLVGALFVALSGFLDVLDGQLARELEATSSAGDVLDHTLDRYADIVLVGGIAAGLSAYLLGFLAITGVLLTSYLGTQAQAAGYGRMYAGLLGRADRLVLIAFGAGIMTITQTTVGSFTPIEWVLVILALVGHLTAIQRFYLLWRDLR